MIEILEAALETIRDFTETGGQVLLIIGGLIFVMWLMILERAMYVFVTHKQYKKAMIAKWQARQERASWNAEQIRQAMISRVSLKLGTGVPIIQSLVALCPLLGLMGTVTGMIEVFQVMAFTGGGDARSMAGGVSKATLPTMAGMTTALSGVFATIYLTSAKNREENLIKATIKT